MSEFKCHFGPDAFLASLMIGLNGRIIGYWRKIFLSATMRPWSLLASPIVKRESRERDSRTPRDHKKIKARELAQVSRIELQKSSE